MGNINITDIVDGTGADGDDINSRLGTIVNEVNGHLDSNNLSNGAVTTSKLVDNAVTKTKLERPHYNALYFSTGGGSGGQVITVQVPVAFDVIDSTNGYGITGVTGSNAYLQIARDGMYDIFFQAYASDGTPTSSFIVWVCFIFDNGTTWSTYRSVDRSLQIGQHQSYSWSHWLPAGTKIQIQYYVHPTNAVRFSSQGTSSSQTDLQARYYLGTKFSITEKR